jgi:hypothetical protein
MLDLCDTLASVSTPVHVPAALYDRIDAAITSTANATDANPISPGSDGRVGRWQWRPSLLGTVASGATLVLLAAMAPYTASRPLDWPALLVLSGLGGMALTIFERRVAR